MAAKYGTFATTTQAAGNTVVVSDVGFQPTFIIFWWSGTTSATDAITGEDHKMGFGVAVSSSDRRCIATQSDDGAATSATDHAHRDDACIATMSTAGAVDGLMDLQSMDAGGFTLVIDDAFPASYIISYLAVSGDSAKTGLITMPGANGNQDTTGLGFDPNGVIFFGVISASIPNATGVDSTMFIGAASGASNQASIVGGADDALVTMKSNHNSNSSECIQYLSAAVGAPASRATFVGFITDGFTINWLERTGTRYVHYLAFKVPFFKVDNLLSRTDTTATAETGLGFPPVGLMFFSPMVAETTVDTVASGHQFSIGGANSPTSRGLQLISDRDNVADAEVNTGIEYDAVYSNISATGSLIALMDIQSFDADGFTFVMDDAEDTSAKFVWYMAFGSAAAAGTILRQMMAHHGD
jgi:hypothetical protein